MGTRLHLDGPLTRLLLLGGLSLVAALAAASCQRLGATRTSQLPSDWWEYSTAVLAADLSLGKDEYGMRWIKAFRKRQKAGQ